MRTFLGFALFVFASAAWTQTAVPPAAVPPGNIPLSQNSAAGSVTGHVYCGDTRLPARLARVNLRAVPDGNQSQSAHMFGMGGGSGMSITGLDGSFHLNHVKPGRYYVDASLPGYVSTLSTVDSHDLSDPSEAAQSRVRSKVQIVEVTENSSARVDLTLDRGAAITGTVRFEDGAPASNVYVTLTSPDGTGSRRTGAVPMVGGFPVDAMRESLFTGVTSGARTDDRGQFRISSLPAGTYLVTAVVSLPNSVQQPPVTGSRGNVSFAMRMTSVRVYAPAALRMSGATQFKLSAGEDRSGADITLPLSGLHNVAGRVEESITANEHGRRFVSLTDPNDGSLTRSAAIEPDGSFALESVPDGNYVLTANGYANASVAVTVHGGDVMDVTLSPPSQQ